MSLQKTGRKAKRQKRRKMDALKKFSSFMLRARVVEVGRDRLTQIKNRLAYLIITNDITDNSRDKILQEFSCPVYQCLTSADVEEMFGFHGTKVIGFHRSPLSNAVLPDLKPYRITKEKNMSDYINLPYKPRVAVLGASGIGRHHCNWWRMEGAQLVAFLGSTEETIAATAAMLKDLAGIEVKGFASLERLLDEDRPDIVDVCLPHKMHYQAVKAALDAGCHVLCEKPFVFDDGMPHGTLREQAEELASLARRQRRMLGVCTQYVMAAQECAALLSERAKGENVTNFEGCLVSPTRNRPPVPEWTWVDLAPHMLGVAQVVSGHGTPDWSTLKVDFAGHKAKAAFDVARKDGSILHCDIMTLHRDEEPKNVRQIALNGNMFDIGGFKDSDGVFQMRITAPWRTEDKPDMLRLLIRSFLKGRLEMPADMACQNLDWMLTVIDAAK